MKRLFYLLSLLLVSHSIVYTMDNENEVPAEATLSPAARVLGKIEKETLKLLACALERREDELQFLDESAIGHVRYVEEGNCSGYRATLANGDKIFAEYFIKGPAKGSLECTRVTAEGAMLPIEDSAYEVLKRKYESQE